MDEGGLKYGMWARGILNVRLHNTAMPSTEFVSFSRTKQTHNIDLPTVKSAKVGADFQHLVCERVFSVLANRVPKMRAPFAGFFS